MIWDRPCNKMTKWGYCSEHWKLWREYCRAYHITNNKNYYRASKEVLAYVELEQLTKFRIILRKRSDGPHRRWKKGLRVDSRHMRLESGKLLENKCATRYSATDITDQYGNIGNRMKIKSEPLPGKTLVAQWQREKEMKNIENNYFNSDSEPLLEEEKDEKVEEQAIKTLSERIPLDKFVEPSWDD